MNILLTNDDGIKHPGILHLKKELEKEHRVIVLAPQSQRSAFSHNISIHNSIRIHKLDEDIYETDGTPADCVKFGVIGFLKEKIDFVASGINLGPNMGIDVFYSGTVAAAREGLINKIPSAAFSLNVWKKEPNFAAAAKEAVKIIDILTSKYYKNNEMYNVNFPNTDTFKGIKVTKLGKRVYNEVLIQRQDPIGKDYYWLGGEFPGYKNEEGTDFNAVENGYVSITPLSLDLTYNKVYDEIRSDFD